MGEEVQPASWTVTILFDLDSFSSRTVFSPLVQPLTSADQGLGLALERHRYAAARIPPY